MIKLKHLLENILTEGVYDPSIFKAILLSGGPGSGKSFIGEKVTAGLGYKFVNSDKFFEHILRKADMAEDDGGLDIDKMAKEEPAKYIRAMDLRAKAQQSTAHQAAAFIHGRLGVVFDGTGAKYDKIARLKQKLDDLGYDTYMLFVNTSLEVAKDRNQNRSRKVPEDVLVQSWQDVQDNLGRYQNLFGSSNFFIVDNNEYGRDDITDKLWKQIRRISRQEPKSHKARQWIANEKKAKDRLNNENPNIRST